MATIKKRTKAPARKSAAVRERVTVVLSPEQAVRAYFRDHPKPARAGPIRAADTASGRGLVKFRMGASALMVAKAR
ncbi:MAG: hypothetical protein IPG63_10235 [Xanthomonadales bacterium]|nr:hypothetical protein [Xanthomonadales bacterium]MBK7145984.1 hypothetical protein [Xanthomonadales bacterium]